MVHAGRAREVHVGSGRASQHISKLEVSQSHIWTDMHPLKLEEAFLVRLSRVTTKRLWLLLAHATSFGYMSALIRSTYSPLVRT